MSPADIPFGIQRDGVSVEAVEAALTLGDGHRIERAVAITRDPGRRSSFTALTRSARHLYVSRLDVMYTFHMDVAVTELRAHLGHWIDVAREGNDIVITDRGTPVARIVALDSTPVIDRLTAQGIISRPIRSTRPVAGDRPRPTPKRAVADIVSEQRR